MVYFEKLLNSSKIRIYDSVESKETLLSDLSKVVVGSDVSVDSTTILDDILAREEIISTGLGMGIAIPHLHKEYVKEITVAFALIKNGVEYNAIDGEPVHFTIMIITSGNEHERYLRVVAKFANILRDTAVRSRLLDCKNSDEVMDILVSLEKE